jgi:ubiquinol-cytochrome c reductase cytochrome c1 subunit
MVRPLGFLVGLFFAGMMLYSALRSGIDMIGDDSLPTAEKVFHLHPKEVEFAHNGPLGKFDRAQLQRGFQVYKEVCSSCHSLSQVAFRDLEDIGYSAGQVKTIATEWGTKQPTFDAKTQERGDRTNTPADKFPVVGYAGQGAPPDLSLMTKARHEGPEYVYSLLTGYKDEQPAELLKNYPDSKTGDGLHYNPYFANLNIAMAAPLVADEQVSYGPGAPKATIDQMSKDVAAFLTWTAEPKLEARKQVGLAAILFILAFTWLAWMSYQNIWSDKKKM